MTKKEGKEWQNSKLALNFSFPFLYDNTDRIFSLVFWFKQKTDHKNKICRGAFYNFFFKHQAEGVFGKKWVTSLPACWSVDDCLWLLLNHKREAGEYVLVPRGVTHSFLISPRISNAPLKFRLVYGVGYRMGGWGASDLRFLWDARPSTLEDYTLQKIICVLTLETFVGKINMAFKAIKQKLPV